MGSRNAILLLLAILVLLFGGIYALYGGAEDADGESGISAAAPVTPEDARSDVDLVAPEDGFVPAPTETARSVVSRVESPGEAAGAKEEGPGPRIRGRIIDKLGVGVPGASVIVAGPGFFPLDRGLEEGDGERWTAETDPDGWFELQGPAPGTARLAVRCAGYAPYSRHDLALPAGERVELEPIMISLGAILSGRVLDPRGRGIEGATLLQEMSSDGAWSLRGMRRKVATTDEQGGFRIDQLACGAWSVLVESEEFPSRTFEGQAESPGREYGGLEFRLRPGDLITGRALAVPAGEYDQLQVRAHRVQEDGVFGFGSRDVRYADLDADGSFVVRGLRPEQPYELKLQTKSERNTSWWWGGGSSRSDLVRAVAGDEGIELSYRPEAALLFRVVDADTRQPVPEFRVEAGIGWTRPLQGEDDEPLLQHPDGRVRYGNLRPDQEEDRAELVITATGYERYERKGIELLPGQELDLGEILLEPVPVLRVTVLDADTRAPVAGAKVELVKQKEATGGGMGGAYSISISAGDAPGDVDFQRDETHRATTDETGVAVLTSMPGETCRLTVTADEFARFEKRDIALPLEKDAEEEAMLLAGGSVRVRVVDHGGAPMPGIGVTHRSPSAGNGEETLFSFGPSNEHITDTDGEVLFDHLATGVHMFQIEEAGGGLAALGMGGMIAFQGTAGGEQAAGWDRVEVLEGETATLTLVAKPRGLLHGRVREAGVPLPGATLRMTRKTDDEKDSEMRMVFAGFGGGSTARTDGDGLYEFANLEAGTYRLTVDHPTRHMPEEFEVRVLEGENRYDLELTVSIVEGRITDLDGEPLAGVRVSAQRPKEPSEGRMVMSRMVMVSDSGEGDVVSIGGGEELSDEVYTDEDGRYRLRGVTPGVELQIEGAGSQVQTGRSEAFEVSPDQVKTGVDFELRVAGTVRVEAVQADGSPARFARVTATYVGDDEENVDPVRGFIQNGSTVLEGMRPGPWKVTVSPFDPGGGGEGAGQEREVEVVAREEAHTTVQLD